MPSTTLNARPAGAGTNPTGVSWNGLADQPLGTLSSKYEVGGRGPGTVSTGAGDAGGASYGSYQMTSMPDGGTVARFVGEASFPWHGRFVGLAPGEQAFTGRWQELAMEAPASFFAVQHAFIERTHYDPLARKIMAEDRLDVRRCSRALQNVVWSTAVQHGPQTGVVHQAIATLAQGPRHEGLEFERGLIRAVYAERGRRGPDGLLVYFRRNSQAVQAGVARRFVEEERDAMDMLASEAARPRG